MEVIFTGGNMAISSVALSQPASGACDMESSAFTPPVKLVPVKAGAPR
jgi:hypothetical protein